MKIFTHNFNPESNSGPNKFTRTLFNSLINNNNVTLTNQEEADVEFCLIQQQTRMVKRMVLRLDGIYFNSEQNFERQNKPIRFSYNNAAAVIFQSYFNKKLTEHWFGIHKKSHVIHNTADMTLINASDINVFKHMFKPGQEVWSCASNWRPHKRLNENIRYFFDNAPKDAILAVAGHITKSDIIISQPGRVILLGELPYTTLISLYKRSKVFVHLSYLDHCPNVVVDAQASGCHIVCSSSGGTSEVVYDGTIIHESEWNLTPIKLYNPPQLDFKNYSIKSLKNKNDNNIVDCSEKYYNVFKEVTHDRN